MKAERHDQRGKPFASPENIAGTYSKLIATAAQPLCFAGRYCCSNIAARDPREVYVRDTD